MKKRLNTALILSGAMLFFATSIIQAQSSTVKPERGLEVKTQNAGSAQFLKVSSANDVVSYDFTMNAQENMSINETNVGSRIFIKKGGNIGINNNNPQESLDVNGNTHINGNGNIEGTLRTTDQIRIDNSNGVFSGRGILEIVADDNGSGGEPMIFKVGDLGASGEKMRISNNGNVGIGTNNPLAKLSISDGNIPLEIRPGEFFDGTQFVTRPRTASFDIPNIGKISFSDTVVFTQPNVGIGTASPEATLDVNGDTKITGKLGLETANSASLIIGNGAGQTGAGIFNTFIGRDAGNQNTSSFNTYIGLEAGEFGAEGSKNTFVGRQAGRTSTGSNNTYMGNEVNRELDSGDRNTLIGERAAGFGNNNSVLGQLAIAGEITFNNQTFEDEVTIMVNNATAIGYEASVVADNKMRFGNSSVTVIEGQVDWSFPSDGRFKNNIKEDIKGLDFIMNLRPVTYHFDVNKYNDFFCRIPSKDTEELASIEAASKILHSGFIAQEVEKAAEDLDYDFSGLVKPQNDKDNYGLRYGSFVVPLVKAVQEQQVQIEEKNELIEAQSEQIEALEARLAKIEAMLSGKVEVNTITSKLTDATLQQNAPNPFTEATNIDYFIPEGVKSASLQVMDQNGRIIKTIPIQATGNGQITLQANLLSAGTYSYSLVLDGRVMETKQMVLTH